MKNSIIANMKTITIEIDESLILPLVELFENPEGRIVKRFMETKLVHKALAERLIRQTRVKIKGAKF